MAARPIDIDALVSRNFDAGSALSKTSSDLALKSRKASSVATAPVPFAGGLGRRERGRTSGSSCVDSSPAGNSEAAAGNPTSTRAGSGSCFIVTLAV